jgi:hypothetical protein
MRSAASLLAAAVLALAGTAGAEIYRCQGPDGTTYFTSDAGACPGARRHEPSREVQRMGDGSGSGAASADEGGDVREAPAPAAVAPAGEDGQAAMWKRKRTDAEAEQRDLQRNLAELKEVVTWCNRGGDLYLEDEVGVRQEYDCGDAHESLERAQSRLAELRRYLSGGLEDECRRAGCLPGWIR